MANRVRGDVGLLLGGQAFTLCFDINALCALEDGLGVDVSELGDLMGGSVKLKTIRTLLWAGLQHHHAGITETEVGQVMQIADLAEVAQKVSEAFAAAFPTPEAGQSAAGPRKAPARAGTGKTS